MFAISRHRNDCCKNVRDWGAKPPTSASSEKSKISFLSDDAKLALDELASLSAEFFLLFSFARDSFFYGPI